MERTYITNMALHDRVIFSALLELSEDGKLCTSQAAIARYCGVCRKTVNTKIKHWSRVGIIDVVPSRGRRCATIRVIGSLDDH